jgi:hypothetical protein
MTIRDKAELDALFADNSTGDISPQDLRDLVDSLMGVYGGLRMANNSTGQTVATNTPEVLTEWTSNAVSNGLTPDYTNDNVTIDYDGVYKLHFYVSFEGVTGDTFRFYIYKNGSITSPPIQCRRKTSSADVGSTSLGATMSLVDGDVLTVWVESDANGTPVFKDAALLLNRIA